MLCPFETTQCQNTEHFHITSDEQSRRIETGNVSSGRTCEYSISLYGRNPRVAYTINTFYITINVEYIHSDTYLGVYRYRLSRDSYELIYEVGAGFTGTLLTTVDINSEIYIQMYPNSTSSSAIFNISSSTNGSNTNTTTTTTTSTSTTSDGGVNLVAIASVILIIIILATIITSCIYYRRALKKCCHKTRNSMKQCCDRRRMPVDDQPYSTQAQMPNNDQRVTIMGPQI